MCEKNKVARWGKNSESSNSGILCYRVSQVEVYGKFSPLGSTSNKPADFSWPHNKRYEQQ